MSEAIPQPPLVESETERLRARVVELEEQLKQLTDYRAPVAWRAVGGSIWGHKTCQDDVPLYDNPHVRRKPLSEAKIDKLLNSWLTPKNERITKLEGRIIARVIEAAHDIT